MLDPASQWSEVPTTAATVKGGLKPPTDLPFPQSSHQQAKLRSTVVGSSRVACRDDVVSESNTCEGPGVRAHRRLVLVHREPESDTDRGRSEPVGAEASDIESVAGISERGEVEAIDPTLEAPPRIRPQGHVARGRFHQF